MRRLLITFAVIVLSGFLAGCSDDGNPAGGEQFGEVSGTVTFTGTWPTTGDVQVSIWASFPPAGPPAGATDPLASGDVVAYKIEGLNKGTYAAITVGWRDPTNPAGAKILGIYWAETDSLGVNAVGAPTATAVSIEISDAQMDWSAIDMTANLDIAP
ncbi:MAG: hypothetical protein KAJ81_04725 [Candidatus Latescibacteria bacterium]|nr:hypothetical protein [Candidatus Latescibacterota bacterium]MCK5734169.1 hypothetical protein [Candidatus Latescibacterota bacterium]